MGEGGVLTTGRSGSYPYSGRGKTDLPRSLIRSWHQTLRSEPMPACKWCGQHHNSYSDDYCSPRCTRDAMANGIRSSKPYATAQEMRAIWGNADVARSVRSQMREQLRAERAERASTAIGHLNTIRRLFNDAEAENDYMFALFVTYRLERFLISTGLDDNDFSFDADRMLFKSVNDQARRFAERISDERKRRHLEFEQLLSKFEMVSVTPPLLVSWDTLCGKRAEKMEAWQAQCRQIATDAMKYISKSRRLKQEFDQHFDWGAFNVRSPVPFRRAVEADHSSETLPAERRPQGVAANPSKANVLWIVAACFPWLNFTAWTWAAINKGKPRYGIFGAAYFLPFLLLLCLAEHSRENNKNVSKHPDWLNTLGAISCAVGCCHAAMCYKEFGLPRVSDLAAGE